MSDHVLAGVFVPLATQMASPGAPDAELAGHHLEALAVAGVDGLMLLGSNGEGALVPPQQTGAFVQGIARRWRAARPGGRLIVNVSAAGTAEAVDRARAASDAAPDALTMTAPSYFRHRPDEVLRHVDAVARIGIPVIVYHLPRVAGPLSPEVVDGLVADERVIGVKDSSGDIEGLAAVVAAAAGRPGFGVSQGDETRLLDGLDRGAVGLLPGTANIAPELAVGLYEAWRRGDRDTAQRLQDVTTALVAIHRVRPGVPTVKRILSERGLGSPVVAEPLVPCTDAEYERLRDVLDPLEQHLIRPHHG
ncbi:MAG: dihydrodipicolinate synthase family protein [Cellulomonas sp.]|jgi:4-hydroxy-tetrahydrodipicolinate synthase|uniref:dihydrodipicolinate synthase family protein n=1 Tax=Cellulomonas sp. TaxID=40001 RepID=UPI0019FA90EB|nr:dihydrodipicolinate synthase family protein [Cellulomonas sp.]MBF0688332.1 dihydrodipicolinate synthase family protein [Cellulomonas sp.]